ncbi:MAG: TIR domain-containing protein [Clostridia bacterium]|nr:TIR domain-containing protein [Clostridia bacterium]
MTGKPYVFISYAHLDGATVLPCIDAMKQSGVNLWYDEGIEAGSEWPEFIAEKVVECSKFVLFISNAYLESQNCKRELNFAISRKKDILSIFIEEVNLSPGMEMQLGTYQAIYRNRFSSDAAFRSSLATEAYFNSCRIAGTQTPPKKAAPSYSNPYTGSTGFSTTSSAHTTGGTPYSAPSTSNTRPSAAAQSNTKVPPVKNRITAGLLAIFLGWIGIQKFYLKQPIWGIIYLVFCSTYIPAILSFIEGIMILCSTDEKFAHKYKCRTKQ